MPILRRTIYKLTDEDREILALGRNNLNEITSRWITHADSGTLYVSDPRDEKHRGYPEIYELWRKAGEPHEEFDYNGRDMVAVESGRSLPDFLHKHGFEFIDWQQRMLLAAQSVHVIAGGFGSAKTAGVGMGAAVFCVMYPAFDFLNLGPILQQAKEMYELVLEEIFDTPFAEKFLISHRESPYPQIILGHSGVGRCRMMFMPADKQAKKAKSMSKDWICIDQAEDQPELTETSLNLRTRLRGTVRGRPRLARMTYIANSTDNDEFWEIFSRAEKDPERYFSINVSYQDNPHLTDSQKADMEDVVGDDPDAVAQHLHGLRIEFGGDIFPKQLVKACQDAALDDMMARGQDKTISKMYITDTAPVVGIHRWLLPYDPMGEFYCFGDGGSANPPRRNSPAITIWNLRGFPDQPARMWGLWWIFGHGDIMPFFDALYDVIKTYKAYGRAYMDTTGTNKGLSQAFRQLYSVGINEVPFGNIKHLMINDMKVLMGQQMMRWPAKIRGLRQQLGRYKLPDDKIAQDLVVTLMMGAYVMRPFMGPRDDEDEDEDQQMVGPPSPVVVRYREGRVGRQGRA